MCDANGVDLRIKYAAVAQIEWFWVVHLSRCNMYAFIECFWARLKKNELQMKLTVYDFDYLEIIKYRLTLS